MFPGLASAHKVIVFAWVEDGMIHTQGSFGSKRKAKKCTIIVKDDTGKVINQGITDLEGMHTFKMPKTLSSDLVVLLDAGNGHKASWTIPKQELMSKTTEKTKKDIKKTKDELNKNPSILKIVGGIGIIFFLAILGKLMANLLKQRKDHE